MILLKWQIFCVGLYELIEWTLLEPFRSGKFQENRVNSMAADAQVISSHDIDGVR